MKFEFKMWAVSPGLAISLTEAVALHKNLRKKVSLSYGSPLILWNLIREAVVLKWFSRTGETAAEKMAINGAISFLVRSLANEGETGNNEDWVLAALSEKLRDSLPLEVGEIMSHEEGKRQFNVTSREQIMEILSIMYGKLAMNEALNYFFLDVRQTRNASLLKSMDRVFRQQEKKDWCGREFNVTDFFRQWTEKSWPRSAIPVVKLLLNVAINDRKNSPSAPSVYTTEELVDYPPIPIFMRSLIDNNESVVWQSEECDVVFSSEEEYVMTLINSSSVFLRMGSPNLLRITYDESGPLGYETLIPRVYRKKMKLSAKEQLTYAADRLHLLL
ncbi:hypothetical protein AB6A40_001942 [Gnathostoma spinigerum]|uniref:Uncharacterized protein n=1 Tax=Gnathostoma spinigerum TaxID=75299 RepID=A0ABD6E5D6_9BILA